MGTMKTACVRVQVQRDEGKSLTLIQSWEEGKEDSGRVRGYKRGIDGVIHGRKGQCPNGLHRKEL